MNYNLYLRTNHWQKIRSDKLGEKNCCQICKSSKNLHIHHKYYQDKKGENILFKETTHKLITLCASCHSLWHRYIKEIKKPNKKICRIRRLVELGVMKNKAFWITGTKGMWDSLYPKINN